MSTIERLAAGFQTFRSIYYGEGRSDFEVLSQGQQPGTMIIGCSDSRVDPAILTACAPGEVFTVRNVANLVPPFELGEGQHGVSAALEFAVCHLAVRHIVVLGHSGCGGIRALLTGGVDCAQESFISRWMAIAEPARAQVLAQSETQGDEERQRATEQASILLSLANLLTFPFVASRVDGGSLFLHGWYFDLAAGALFAYGADTGSFAPLVA